MIENDELSPLCVTLFGVGVALQYIQFSGFRVEWSQYVPEKEKTISLTSE